MEFGTLSNESVDVPDVKNGKFVQWSLKESRGVARGGPGVPVTPLGRRSFEQTTYNI